MGLKSGDLNNLVYRIFEIDSYKSKMGSDADITVLSFTVYQKQPAVDLVNFIEKGYSFVLDADVSPGEQDDGSYRVFVEIERDRHVPEQIIELLDGISKLTDENNFKFRYYKGFKSHKVTFENLEKELPLDPDSYSNTVTESNMNNFKNFFNKSYLEEIDLNDLQVADTATIENLVVNNQIDMTLGQIKNVSTPTDNGDATNKQFVDTNFLNKVISTTQTIGSKIDFIGTNYTTNIALPVLDLITSTSGASNGAFIRTYKNLNRVANLEIGGLSYISEVPTNTVRREVDLIFRTNANTLAEMVINMNNSTLTPFLINEDKYETKNNNYYILKQDGTQLLYYTSSNDDWAMSKDLNMTT